MKKLSDLIIRGTVPFQKLIKQLLCSEWQSIECFIYQLSQWPLIRCVFTKGQQQVIIYLRTFPGKWTTQKSIRRVHFYRVALMSGLLAGFSRLGVNHRPRTHYPELGAGPMAESGPTCRADQTRGRGGKQVECQQQSRAFFFKILMIWLIIEHDFCQLTSQLQCYFSALYCWCVRRWDFLARAPLVSRMIVMMPTPRLGMRSRMTCRWPPR